MEALIKELIPTSPDIGLYVGSSIPPEKKRNALKDYASTVDPIEVLALYDATLLGGAKDGAVFTSDRLVFQNTDLDEPKTVRYGDIVRVHTKRNFLSGRKVVLDVNSGGRATVEMVVDFSGKPKAAEFVAKFLYEAMLRTMTDSATELGSGPSGDTDVNALRKTLRLLIERDMLSEEDFSRIMDLF